MSKSVVVNLVNDEAACPLCGEEYWFDPCDEGLECDCGVLLLVGSKSQS